jgi:aminopeptidase N
VTSLTRDEACARADLLRVRSYDIELDLTGVDRHFGSRTTIRFECREPGAATFVDVAALGLHSVTLNGTSLDPAASDNRLELAGLQAENELVVDAVMTYSHDGEGLHRHVDPADDRSYLYAMSFLDAGPRWFASFDQPDLKAPVRFDVRCPRDWTVAGNGPASEVEPGRWQLASNGPLATYFTTLVAGPYHEVRDEHDGIPLVLHARQSLAEHLDREAGEMFSYTKRSFDELHRLFAVRYPWGEYHQAFVPEFNAGAMENPGCVTLRDTYVFRSRVTEAERLSRGITIAHEMAHMWFGDLVTMRWWDDLWLNESFAEYLGHRVLGEPAWIDFGAARKPWGFTADRRPSTHPVAGNGSPDAASALNDFDGISYAKGASVLRQLALHLGDDVFVGGLRDYIKRYAESNAELADLLAAWGEAGAADIDAWSQAWLRTTGLDALAVTDGSLLRTSHGTPRTHSIEVVALAPDGAETARSRVSVQADRTPLDGLSGAVVLPDAADETWAKLILPAETWMRMATLLPGIADARGRVAVWNALQLAVADAELDPTDALDVVTMALPAETGAIVLARIGRWAQRTVAGTYLSDAARPGALVRIADAMLGLCTAAAPGSGRQLAAARVAIAAAPDASLLRGWLGGAGTPDGLVVDTELRWTILERLALLGELSPAEIAAAAAADHSSSGAVHAARCRASRPDADAKADAWAAMLRDPDAPNYELYALAEGFWDPAQRELTEPYVERYFAEIAGTAALRSGWVVDRIAELAYPWAVVAEYTAAATRELLADDSLHPGIRRSVVDVGDDLGRALAVRARYS